MNQVYKEIHKQADRLHHHTEAMIDDDSDDNAEQLSKLARNVMETIESDRPPRSIEDAVKRVQQLLEKLKAAPTPAISPQDADRLHDEFEDLRRDVRDLPNY